MKNVLLICAHQKYENISEGKLNHFMMEKYILFFKSKGHNIKTTYIEKGYNIDEEIQKHEWADIIITQSPVYWFSTPWIHKKYIDEIFTGALQKGSLLTGDGRTRSNKDKQYGSGGKISNKSYMLSLTWNAPKEAFNDKNQVFFEGKNVDEVFIHQTNTYKFCGYNILPIFSLFDVIKNPNIDEGVKKLETLLSDF